MPVSYRWFLLLVTLLGPLHFVLHPCSAATVETVTSLKRSLNQLVRQQNVQLSQYKSRLESSTLNELHDSTFALSEVFMQCTLSWRSLQSQFNAADATCASGAAHTPQSMANEAVVDLNQCLAEVEAHFLAVTAAIDESLGKEIDESWKLNFWLQAKLFSRSTSKATTTFPLLLDTFNATATAQQIYREAVLWDNVDSIQLYTSVRDAAAPLRDAGEWGFICGLNSYNKLFQKLKNTEAYLNTNCSGAKSSGRENGTAAADVAGGHGNTGNSRGVAPEVVHRASEV